MRFPITAALFAVLAACSQAPASTEAPPPDQFEALVGRYLAASNTARAITGDVEIERAGIAFHNRVILYTRVLHPRSGGDLIARGGETYAAAVLGSGDLIIELRRVLAQTVPAGEVGVCGAERPQYVALAYDARATNVKLLVFAGDEPPGPEALHSRVCASFAYAAPDGARTREGVVLRLTQSTLPNGFMGSPSS